MEYHDPAGLFSLISHDISSRLPLRNLQWKNATRPVRQINSLHLDFVPDATTKNNLRPPTAQSESEGVTSFDVVRGGSNSQRNALKERRHQIPGFQSSPYLRIYILRADDKDTYKATERQKIREWIRDNAEVSSKSKAKNHDAFEWLIVHVVVPDTTAASEPRWREASAKDPDELRERKQGIKLPGKSTRTVFDKLRADFNETGKGSLDRVAQIRLTRAQMSSDLLPTPALATTIEETHEEREKAWNDLMGKLRALILGPFDLRVRQYETVFAEQETRRSMPGFNFCTFFIQKEGLAKALESIGLVEDALVIYDELSLGLETVIRDLARGQAEGTATTFAPYTSDFADRIIGMRMSKANGVLSNDSTLHGSHVGESLDVDYRERIVRSDISVFDFFSYIFTRQKALILRIANAKSVTSFIKDGVENLLLISEVCWRASSFVHNNARTLRQDLMTLRNKQWEDKADATLSGADIESLVCSWTYTVAGRILDETESSSVDQFPDLSKRDSITNGTVNSHSRSDSHLPGGVSAHPLRTTSLARGKSRVAELQNRTPLQSASESDLTSPRSSSTFDEYLKPGAVTPGLLELVTYRAELFMMQRKMLDILAKQRGWLAGWATLKEQTRGSVEEIDLKGDVDHSADHAKAQPEPVFSTLTTPALVSTLESKTSFYLAYERLSDKAMRLYVAATQTKTAESIMGDLAILKSQQGDYEYAVSYFQHVLPLYAADGWSFMEDEALKTHASCLKHLNRTEEYVKVLLTSLAKACGRVKAAKDSLAKLSPFDGILNVHGVLAEVIDSSHFLDSKVEQPAEHFFSEVRLANEVIHLDETDGFALRLHVRHLLDDELQVDHLSARLTNFDDPSLEIWLANDSPGCLKCGDNSFNLTSHAVAFGLYCIDKVVIQAGKLCFVHEFSKKSTPLPTPPAADVGAPNDSHELHKQPWVFLYPFSQAFDAKLRLAKDVHVNKSRYLDIELESGRNNITSTCIRLRPASAGLRLHLADSLFDNVQRDTAEGLQPGGISLGRLACDSTALVKVPYSLEQVTPDILIRFEAEYTTTRGSFSLAKSVKLVTQLPLDVDVNDTFHLDYLLSKFVIRTTRDTPLTITQASLAASSIYEVEAPEHLDMPIMVFESQPVNLLYKITRKAADQTYGKKSAALALRISYCAMDELIVNTLQSKLATALDSSPFSNLSRLLLPVLHDRSRQLFSRSDLELATLIGEATVPSFEDIGWHEIVGTLPATLQAELLEWLTSWHRSNDRLDVHQDGELSRVARSITISVEVPRIDFVHEVSLLVPDKIKPSPFDPQVLKLGETVSVQLTVASTNSWSNTSIDNSHKNQNLAELSGTDFMLDIHCDSDQWLIGGQRRFRFTAKADLESTFNVLLVPLQLGIQSLPTVDIQPVQSQQLSDEPKKASEPPIVSSEMHCSTAGQLVRVIRGIRKSQVIVAESASSARPPSRPATANTAKEAG